MHHSTRSVNGSCLRRRCSGLIRVSVGEDIVTPPDQAIDFVVVMSDTMLHQIRLHRIPDCCIRCNSRIGCRAASAPQRVAAPAVRVDLPPTSRGIRTVGTPLVTSLLLGVPGRAVTG
jgi:hypothetical protein